MKNINQVTQKLKICTLIVIRTKRSKEEIVKDREKKQRESFNGKDIA